MTDHTNIFFIGKLRALPKHLCPMSPMCLKLIAKLIGPILQSQEKSVFVKRIGQTHRESRR